MLACWRSLLFAATALALLPAGAAARSGDTASLDPTALEELEGLLRDLGFDPGPVDGVADDDTTAAIRRYQDFALLPGEPKPDQRLLNELRGVAAAFAALSAAKEEISAAPPEPEALPAETPAKTPAKTPTKTVVPPHPPPPKLTAPEEFPEEAPEELVEPPAQTVALPPTPMPQPILSDEPGAAAPGEETDPAAALQARIEAELLRFLHRLNEGSLSRDDLARQFNAEGRALLQQAQYEEAILKFSVAIHLDPDFAGAYSNRGTAYRRQKESGLAKADFEKARELGFGGLRAKDASNPLN